MISSIRRFFQSKIGMAIFIAFLVIVALAFAAADITGSTFGGVASGDRIAVVGDERVPASELESTANSALAQVREQDPTIGMPEFVEQGLLEEVLRQLIDQYAIGNYAEELGLRAGRNLVNSEILQIPAFRNVAGEFDEEVYQQALRAQGVTDEMLRGDLKDGLLQQMLLRPALAAPQLSGRAARQYASLVLESRRGAIALIPSALYAPEGDPEAGVLEAYYEENLSQFRRPEQRVIRFATFGPETILADIEPTEEEIAQRYEANSDAYEARERRAVSSFVVPTEDAAKSLVERIRGGLSLEAAARQAGFQVSSSDLRDRETMANATSFAFAEAVFDTAEGEVVEPARGTLGWYVARVDDVEQVPARSLAEASEEIAQQILEEKRAAALVDLSARIEDELYDGTSLAEVADAFDLEVRTSPALLANGTVYGEPGAEVPRELGPVLETAFEMDESQPQLAALGAGQRFIVYDVSEIRPSAAPPLAEIRDEVTAAWRRAEGSAKAREAARRVLEKTREGTDFADALRAENEPRFQVQPVALSRRELLAQRGRDIAPPLVLLFSMAEGSTKLLEAPENIGWYLVDLEEVETGDIEADDPVIAQTRQQFAPTLAEEYRRQLTRAIREEVGVERNEDAIEAIRRRLAGES
ncbi:peptidylprolyl isomerase [Erythrobacter sp.]|uniref:peptidylprolyl isomerase n=1 Tax=Erythrobacter sp. TaxID=1042 RepID=UPI001425F8EE|nr:peptidylprolyl isomerase [Erythrobacter sp.]QIQ86018.1 MAG: peptidylprolyl isomerase [Erythrobacter sp.]